MRLLLSLSVAPCIVTPLRGQTRVFFSGRVDNAPVELQPQFQEGMSMSGSYTIDPSLSPGPFISSITDFEMTIGDYLVQKPQGDLRGDITITASEYVAVSFAEGEPVGDGLRPALMALQFHSDVGLTDLSSPVPPPLDLFDRPEWTVDFSGLDVRLSGTVESLAVPEPSSLLLIVLAGLCLARSRGRSANPKARLGAS